MFNKGHFIQDCIELQNEDPQAMRELVAKAISDPREVILALGEVKHAGITPLYRSAELTIINFTWAPYMSLLPHNHQMPAVIGVYAGREDNIFWRKKEHKIEAAGAKSLGTGEVASLGHNIIHSVLNPLQKMTASLHIYSGDFFQPKTPRSQWDHETLLEQAWDIEQAKSLFSEAEARFNATHK